MVLRRMLLMLAAVAVVVLALAAYKGYSIYQQVQMFSAPPPPISVEAEPARSLAWQQRLPAIGSLKAVQGVDLTAEISGTVSELLFQSGQRVERDQPLLRLSSEVEQASLKSAEAALALANVERDRARNLVGRQAISRSEYDRLDAQALQAKANVEQLRATLDKRRVLAPFSGRIGLSRVERGDFLAAGAPIATLQDLSSLEADFSLPENRAPQLAVGQRVLIRVAAYPDERFEGEIIAINPRVDDSTRNLQLRARLANPEERLLPGMFAQLEVVLPGEPQRIVVPETAVTYSLYGNALYVVQEKDAGDEQKQQVAERRFVTTGERRDGLVVIEQGLHAGEWVVTSGQLKLDHGSPVTLAPAAAHAPAP
ncbi:RND transporter [Pseudomonas flexibilis]|uniref:Membrane fusion protein, multidrug efflux system n=1 Tax=Pseudomonas flexibilis TaxID=706570 RepID=A0A1N6NA25_9PSED|nr:efflux RND transporter periplasmic adaptor subunit [Pseudomonas flexibilis]KHL70909.1 RND transporter [Pseudomonas flexibilis]SIP88931.1 membrane fusion protein, multidrug efflux system [Pseudomonas flexibilis]